MSSGVVKSRWTCLALAVCLGCDSNGDVMAPPPEKLFSTEVEAPPPLPLTVVNVPLLVDLNSAVAMLEEALPTRFGDIDRRRPVPGNKRGAYAYEVTREPFKVEVRSDTFQIGTTIHYQGRGWYDPPIAPEIGGSCGTDGGPKPRARVTISIRPEIDRSWKLVATPKLTRLSPLTRTERDQCEVTFLKIDVTGKVLNAARDAIRGQLPKVAAKLAAVDVKGEMEDVWTEIQKPIELTDSVWLMLQPEGIRLGQISGNRSMLGGTIGITARPKIETGARPAVAFKPLPPLDSASTETGLNMLVEARFDYPMIGSSLTSALKGTRIRPPGGVVEIREVAAFGIGGGRLALGVRFGGTSSGLIYFVGTPRYDETTGRIMVPDLDYEAATVPLLVKGLAWIKADEIRDYLRAQATFPSSEAMDRLADLAVKGMNRQLTEGIFLTASLNRTEVLRILPRPDALYLQAHTEGQAALHVTDEFFARLDPAARRAADSVRAADSSRIDSAAARSRGDSVRGDQ